MKAEIFIFLIFVSFSANARGKRDYELLSSTEVFRRASKFDTQAVIELGARRDKSAAAVLRKILAEKVPDDPTVVSSSVAFRMTTQEKIRMLSKADQRNSIIIAQQHARVALAKLGDEESLNIILKRLESEDQQIVSDAILDAGSSGNKRAVKYLIPFLKPSGWKEMRSGKNSATAPHWSVALDALCANQVETCEKIDAIQKRTGEDPRSLWMKWWEKNRKDLEN